MEGCTKGRLAEDGARIDQSPHDIYTARLGSRICSLAHGETCIALCVAEAPQSASCGGLML